MPRSWRSQIADEVRACSMMKPKTEIVEDDFEDDEWDEGAFKCPTCNGTGVANPCSPHLPKDALVLGSTECPRCEGAGDF